MAKAHKPETRHKHADVDAPDVLEPEPTEAPEIEPEAPETPEVEPEPLEAAPSGPEPNVILERQSGSRVEIYHPQGRPGAFGRPFYITHPDDGSGTPVVYTQSEIEANRWIYRSRD